MQNEQYLNYEMYPTTRPFSSLQYSKNHCYELALQVTQPFWIDLALRRA